MGQCKLFINTIEDTLLSEKIISPSGKILIEGRFTTAKGYFNSEFEKIYGVAPSGGLGVVSNGSITFNEKAKEFEKKRANEAQKAYPDVNLAEGVATITSKGEIFKINIPENFATKVSLALLNDKSKVFTKIDKEGNSELVDMKGIMALTNQSGLVNLFIDLENSSYDNIAGLSITDKQTINSYLEKGENYLEKVKEDMAKFNSPQEYVEDLVNNDPSIDQGIKGINDILNIVLKRTNTSFLTHINLDIPVVNKKSAGAYATDSDIFLNIHTLGVWGGDSNTAQAYIHEKGHVVTMNLLAKDATFRKKMEDLYKVALDAGVTGYGMTDLLEFAAESLSNKEFQDKLKGVKYKKNNIFDLFTEALREVFERLTGIVLENDLLSDVLLTQFQVISSTSTNPLNGRMSQYVKLIEGIEMEGNWVVNKGDVANVHKAAKAVGLVFEDGKGFSYIENGQVRYVKKDDVAFIVNQKLSNFIRGFSVNAGGQAPAIQMPMPDFNDLETILDINSLKQIQGIITPPAQSESKKYEIGSKEFFRTTESLGFGVTEAQTDELLANAAAIGNLKDELGKRVFRGDENSNISFEKVSDLVKEEAFERAKSEGIVDEILWNRLYHNPVSRDAFEILKNELARVKDNLITDHNVKKFHTDIIVWNNDTKIAGEIDVLAELNDGSFTVIDLKTRRQGTEGYADKIRGYWSTREKHVMQTNTYSNALEKMGFKVNAPKIIISQPVYSGEGAVKEADFVEIEGNDFVILLDLDRRSEENMINYYNEPGNSLDSTLRNKSEAARSRYKNWFLAQRRLEGHDIPTFELNEEAAREQLTSKLDKIRRSLGSYKKITKADPTAGTLSQPLDEVLILLDKISKSELDDVTFEQQLLISNKFFGYAAEQLEELRGDLEIAFSDIEAEKATYLKIKNYRGVFHTAKELFEVLKVLSKSDLSESNKAAYEAIEDEFNRFEGIDAELGTQLNITRKNIFRHIVLQSYLGSRGEIKMNNILQKEAEELFGSDKEAIKDYINKAKHAEDYQAKVKEAAEEEVNKLINSPSHDILAATFFFNNDLSIDNDFIQLFNKMIMNSEQRFTSTANAEVIELAQLQAELGLSDAEIKQLAVFDTDGNHFLMSDYKIEFKNANDNFRKQLKQSKLERDNEVDPDARMLINVKIAEIEAEYEKWIKENTQGHETKTPIDSWKTDYSVLSPNQLRALNFFKGITIKNQERMLTGAKLLQSHNFNSHYFKLPSIKKTGFGFVMEGDFLGAVKKQWTESTKIEVGDTEEGQASIDSANGEEVIKSPLGLDGKPLFTNPAFYRGQLQGDAQSLDLFTVYALELQNGIRHEINGSIVADATVFLDMVNESEFIQKLGGKNIVSKWAGDKAEAATLKGEASQVSRAIQKMMKNRIFSMSQEYSGNIFGQDKNRLASTISAYTAFAAMSFKGLGAANNWITGNASTFIEAAGGEFFNKTELANAKATYWNNIASTVGDIGQPVKTSRINQIMAIFDVFGDRDILNNEFERRNKLTQIAKAGTSLGGYSMGEHEIHGTLAIAMLQSQKVINKEGKYLNGNGEIVSKRKEAASIYEALQKNDTGVVTLAKWAEYSEFDPINKLSKTGLASLRALIKDRVTRTQGAYDSALAGELNRLWWGKLIVQFKKHMPPQMLNRFRGMGNANIPKDKLAESKKYYNFKSKTEEYGYYTTFIRTALNMMKAEKFNIAGYMKAGKNEWSDMHLHERANIKKTITELSYIATVLILAGMLSASLDGDDDALWVLTYLLRRQANEGGLQYLNPAENWRVVESPMAAIKKINTVSDTFAQLLNPSEVYDSGVHRHENKLWVKAKRTAIVGGILDQLEKGYSQRMFNNVSK